MGVLGEFACSGRNQLCCQLEHLCSRRRLTRIIHLPMSTPNDAGPAPKEITQQEKTELEKTLNREAAAFQRDLEACAVAKCCD